MASIWLLTLLTFLTVSCQDLERENVSFITPDYSDLPFKNCGSNVKPLRSLTDVHLQNSLLRKLQKNAEWKALISQKKMAVGLVDLREPEHVRFARVNDNIMMYAASLPKIAILLAAADALEKGELEETEEVKQDLRLMISKSDNYASTRMIDRLGYEKIESVLRDPKYNFYDQNAGGGLWVGKRYASKGRRYPEPIKGLSHAATVSQVCRFYYLLAYGQLVSPERSEMMLECLHDPELHHKFVNSVESIDPEADLYRKSGTWRIYHADSILVWGDPDRRYILVALVEALNGESILRQLVYIAEEVLSEKV